MKRIKNIIALIGLMSFQAGLSAMFISGDRALRIAEYRYLIVSERDRQKYCDSLVPVEQLLTYEQCDEEIENLGSLFMSVVVLSFSYDKTSSTWICGGVIHSPRVDHY